MRSTRDTLFSLLLVGLVSFTGPARAETSDQSDQAPAPPPTFAAALDVVLVDAVVTDGNGRLVKGLTADDFVVREDGAPQLLTSFEAVDLARTPQEEENQPGPVPPSRSSSNETLVSDRPRRVFLVVLDDAGLGLASMVAAQGAVKQFLAEATRPGDTVSLLAPAAGIGWTAALPEGQGQLVSIVDSVKGRRALSPELASDWEALQTTQGFDPLTEERMRVRLDAGGMLPRAPRFPFETEEEYNNRNRTYQEPFLRADSRRQLNLDRNRRRELFAAISATLRSLASIKGRKAVLLLSEGFVQEPDDPAFRDLVAVLRKNHASIYFVNVKGLTSGTAADARQAGDRSASTQVVNPQDSAGAEVVAEETGGFSLTNPNDLAGGITRIAEESSSYYILSYSSSNPRRDGKYRQLHVELRRADLRVRARKGYFGPSDAGSPSHPDGKAAADPELDQTLGSAEPERGIPLRLTAFTMQPVDKARLRVRVVAEVGLRPLVFETESDGALVATLDVALAMNHVKPQGRQRTPWREWKVRVPPQARGLDVWVPLEATFDVPAGASQARLAVRDRASRAKGSVLHGFEVPEPASWRVSTPILSHVPGEERGSPPQMLVTRSFVAGSPLYCYLEVYNAAKAKGGTGPRISLGYAVIDARGKTKKTQAASLLAPGPTGTPTRLEAIPLSGMPPGPYELRLTVRDETSGQQQELREPFVLRRPSRPDLPIYLELLHAYLAGDVGRASAGVMEWRPQDLEKLAGSLPREDVTLRKAALMLHTAIAFRLWGNARALEADAQIAIGRAVLAGEAPPELHRDWLLALGSYQLAAASPVKALAFFEECTRLFPAAAEAWLGAGICHELTAFPDGFAFAALPDHDNGKSAERSYREAKRLDPRLAEARLRLGRVLSLAQSYEEAETELAAAVEASSDRPQAALAQVHWGVVRDARGDLLGAVSHYEAALAADPESQTAALALSEALHRRGDHRQAAECLTSVIRASRSARISPWHAYHLGHGRWKELLVAPPETPNASAGSQP